MAKKSKKKAAKPPAELPLGDGVGVGRVSIPELDELASIYKRVRDRRQDLTKKEVDAKQALTDGVHQHEEAIGRDADGVLCYVYEDDSSPTGRSVVVNEPTGEQTKVQVYKDPGAPEEE